MPDRHDDGMLGKVFTWSVCIALDASLRAVVLTLPVPNNHCKIIINTIWILLAEMRPIMNN